MIVLNATRSGLTCSVRWMHLLLSACFPVCHSELCLICPDLWVTCSSSCWDAAPAYELEDFFCMRACSVSECQWCCMHFHTTSLLGSCCNDFVHKHVELILRFKYVKSDIHLVTSRKCKIWMQKFEASIGLEGIICTSTSLHNIPCFCHPTASVHDYMYYIIPCAL